MMTYTTLTLEMSIPEKCLYPKSRGLLSWVQACETGEASLLYKFGPAMQIYNAFHFASVTCFFMLGDRIYILVKPLRILKVSK